MFQRAMSHKCHLIDRYFVGKSSALEWAELRICILCHGSDHVGFSIFAQNVGVKLKSDYKSLQFSGLSNYPYR